MRPRGAHSRRGWPSAVGGYRKGAQSLVFRVRVSSKKSGGYIKRMEQSVSSFVECKRKAPKRAAHARNDEIGAKCTVQMHITGSM